MLLCVERRLCTISLPLNREDRLKWQDGSRANRDKLAPAITVVSLRASWAVTSEDHQCKCVLCLLSLVPRCLSIACSIIYMVHSSSLVRHPSYSPSSLAILLFNRFTVCTLCLGLVVSRVHRRRCSWVERSSPTLSSSVVHVSLGSQPSESALSLRGVLQRSS